MGRHGIAVALATLLLCACGGGGTGDEPVAPDPVFRAHQERFTALYQAGDYAKAMDEAVAAMKQAPQRSEPYVWISGLYSRLGRDEQGIAFFAERAKADPNRYDAWFYKGRHELRTNKLADALASFQKASELDPKDPESHYWQGVTLHGLGDFEGAIEAYRRAYEMDPGSSKKAVLLVRVLRETGDYDEAETVATDALRRSPDAADLHYAVGQLRLRAQDYPAAETALRRAIQLDPRNREAHQDLATVLARTGREGEALVERAVASRLNDYESGKANMRGNLSKSRDPAVPMLFAELELTERQLDAAVRWYNRSVALGGRNVRTLAGLAEAEYLSGNVAAGDAALAQTGDAQSPRIDLARAARLVQAGDKDAAAQMLEKAVRGGPEEREFLRRAADLYADLGRVSESAVLLARAARAPRTSSAPGTLD